jgi:hypothetical protein
MTLLAKHVAAAVEIEYELKIHSLNVSTQRTHCYPMEELAFESYVLW